MAEDHEQAEVRGALAFAALLLIAPSARAAEPLRVCADPADLPFSDAAGEGFENRIVALVASHMQRPLQYVWRAQRRGYLHKGLIAGACDLVTATPLGSEGVAVTRPYYRSTYAFVTRPGEPAVTSVDDPSLASRRIGVQLIGDDAINSPPAHLLTWRGHVSNVRGYSVYGDTNDPDSARRIVDAVASGHIDVAAVWGPVAGYFAARENPPLVVTPIRQPTDVVVPMSFDIAMAVRRNEPDLLRDVDAALAAAGPEIARILADYHVPVAGD